MIGEDTADSDIDLSIGTTHRKNADALISRCDPGIVSPEEAARLRERDRPLFERIRSGRVLAGEVP